MSGLSAFAQGASVTARIQAATQEGRLNSQAALVRAENDARIAESRAESDEFSARVAEQRASSEIDKAGRDASDFRRAQKARLASARARQAASGITLEGSPLMVDEATFAEIEFGAHRLVESGQLSASRLRDGARLSRITAGRARETARLARSGGQQSASNIRSAAKLKAFSAGLSGVSTLANFLDSRKTLSARETEFG